MIGSQDCLATSIPVTRKNGRMEDWKNGRLEEWKIGRMEGWRMDLEGCGPSQP